MNSPTSDLLHSIQALKNKLRSDHSQLQDIRKDFALPLSTIPQELYHVEFKAVKPCGKECRQKLIDLRKRQQAELTHLATLHKEEKQQLIEDYEAKLRELQEQLVDRMKEQEEYIASLEDQIAKSSTIRGLCEQEDGSVHSPREQYDHVVNSLMKENALLLENVEMLKMENRKLAVSQLENLHPNMTNLHPNMAKTEKNPYCRDNGQYSSMVQSSQNCPPVNKNRLKFSKVSESRNVSNRSQIQDENSDISNYLSEKVGPSTWDEESIMSEDMKIRTIKHLIACADRKPTHCR